MERVSTLCQVGDIDQIKPLRKSLEHFEKNLSKYVTGSSGSWATLTTRAVAQ